MTGSTNGEGSSTAATTGSSTAGSGVISTTGSGSITSAGAVSAITGVGAAACFGALRGGSMSMVYSRSIRPFFQFNSKRKFMKGSRTVSVVVTFI